MRSRLLDPELLRTFVAVVDCGGYTAAAPVLHLTQAAVSQQVARLAQAAGVALFEGPRRQLKLTPQGSLLLDYARRLIALNHEAMERLRPDGVSGVVRMGATHYYAMTVLPPLLTGFARRHPGIHIDLEVGVAGDMQRKLGASLDLTINSFASGRRNGVLLRRDPAVWAVSRRSPPHGQDPLPMALLPPGSLLRRWAEEALLAAGRRWSLVQESSNIDVLKASVVAGLAVGVFQRATVKSTRELRMLAPSDGFARLPVSEMWLECAERELPPAARCLYEYLVEHLPPWEARQPVTPVPARVVPHAPGAAGPSARPARAQGH
ncbi:MAG TPA: LysR substrate-binding domain-containing protein [Ramlibacter sp.]|nr:LysR substrate-binding domain-containing protein [Ramlibacter sp.]